jgi:Flp pilus assembly protein TadD
LLEKIYSVRNQELSSKQIKISKILQNILDLQKKGNFKESLNYCEILNKNGYKTAAFLHLYGLALRGNGEINKAIEKIELAIGEKEKDATILNSLGVLHLQNDQAERISKTLPREWPEVLSILVFYN